MCSCDNLTNNKLHQHLLLAVSHSQPRMRLCVDFTKMCLGDFILKPKDFQRNFISDIVTALGVQKLE